MENQKIIDELYFCAAQCNHCYDACQMETDREELKNCMMHDEDCADICRLTGRLLERNSDNVELFMRLCAEICEKCAVECEKHLRMEHCKKCAEACRKCAEMCRNHQLVHS